MENKEKEQICEALRVFCERAGSQNKAAAMLKGVSGATLSQILAGKWEKIAPEMWRNVQAQLNGTGGWMIAETRAFQTITQVLGDAKEHANVYAMTGGAGCGKTAAEDVFKSGHDNVYLVKCGDYWNKKTFLCELLRAMGREASGANIGEMVADAVSACKRAEKPLIILDEVDKLADPVLYFFITLYNELEGVCGIVLLATEYLEKRMIKGLRLGRKGYREIYSRVGGKFLPIPSPDEYDVHLVCQANGLSSSTASAQIARKSEGDLRRVKRMIHAEKLRREGK